MKVSRCLLSLPGLLVAFISPAAGTLAASPTPVSFYRLRFDLSTTSLNTRITASETTYFLTARVLETTGNIFKQGVSMASLWVAQTTAGNMGIVADYAAMTSAASVSLPYVFEKDSGGASVLRVFNVSWSGETSLLEEVQHSGSDTIYFSLDLTALQGFSSLTGNVPDINSGPEVFAYYYPWHASLSDWSSSYLLDIPQIPYVSHDPAAIARHIEQAKSAGIDGWLSSWVNSPAPRRSSTAWMFSTAFIPITSLTSSRATPRFPPSSPPPTPPRDARSVTSLCLCPPPRPGYGRPRFSPGSTNT